MKKIQYLLACAVLCISLNGYADNEMTVTISPTYDNPPFTLSGMKVRFNKYDMQRYKENETWHWTINYCEVYVEDELICKIHTEKMDANAVFTKVVGSKSTPRTVEVKILDMPKVTREMHCRGPVQPCWTLNHPVTRAKTITLKISIN